MNFDGISHGDPGHMTSLDKRPGRAGFPDPSYVEWVWEFATTRWTMPDKAVKNDWYIPLGVALSGII